jgi:hypothetical protein
VGLWKVRRRGLPPYLRRPLGLLVQRAWGHPGAPLSTGLSRTWSSPIEQVLGKRRSSSTQTNTGRWMFRPLLRSGRRRAGPKVHVSSAPGRALR